MTWTPHVTVACVIEQQGKFLCVEELSNGQLVINQPAGHLEANESLIQAAVRETLEETGWQVEVTDLLGFYTYTSPHNKVCYHRWCFVATPIQHIPNHELDSDIIQALWLDADTIRQSPSRLRSPLVLQAIEDYLSDKRYPLALLCEQAPSS